MVPGPWHSFWWAWSPKGGRQAQHFEQQFCLILSPDLLPWLSNHVREYRDTDQLDLFWLDLTISRWLICFHTTSEQPQDSTGLKGFCWQSDHTGILFCEGFTMNGWQEFELWCHGQCSVLGPEETRKTSKTHITKTKPAKGESSLHPCSLSHEGVLSVWFNVPISPATCASMYFKF